MKLSKEQISRIREFISKRGFTQYDLQLEIIDHVACKVEELMTADSSLSIDDAISLAHGQFGPMGFSVFEDAMRQSLQKRYWKLFRQTAMAYLNWKYLPLIGGLIYLVYWISLSISNPQIVFFCSWGLLMISMIIYGILNYRKQRRYRSMLTMQMGNTTIITTNILFQMYNMANSYMHAGKHTAMGVPGIVSGVFLSALIIYYLSMQHIQKVAIENCRELEEQYQLTVNG
ncbi:MAG: hypothetical protein V4592_20110 [Bacteroidota bacterium]